MLASRDNPGLRIPRTDVPRRWCEGDAFTNLDLGPALVNDTMLAVFVGLVERANPGVCVAFREAFVGDREGQSCDTQSYKEEGFAEHFIGCEGALSMCCGCSAQV